MKKKACFTWEFFISCFPKEKEGQNILLASAVFQESLAQNNPYAKDAYFGGMFCPPWCPFCVIVCQVLSSGHQCFSLYFSLIKLWGHLLLFFPHPLMLHKWEHTLKVHVHIFNTNGGRSKPLNTPCPLRKSTPPPRPLLTHPWDHAHQRVRINACGHIHAHNMFWDAVLGSVVNLPLEVHEIRYLRKRTLENKH